MIAVTEQEASPLRPVPRTERCVLPHTSPGGSGDSNGRESPVP